MKRKIFAALLAVMMVVSMLPLSVMAAVTKTFVLDFRNMNPAGKTGDGSMLGVTVILGDDYEIPVKSTQYNGNPKKYYKVGYTFEGWTANGKTYADGDTISAEDIQALADKSTTGKATIKSIWTANTDTPYKVRHLLMNTTGEKLNKAYATYTFEGTTDTMTNVEPLNITGYEAMAFEQLNIEGDGSTVVDIKYKLNKYNLTYELDGGNFVDETEETVLVAYNKTLTAPADPEKEGYTFLGWSINGEIVEHPSKMPATNLTLTAQWEKNAVEFTFRNLSVNGKIWHGGFTKSLALDQDYTIPAVADTFNARPEHYYDSADYTFVGWVDGLGNEYEDGATIPAATINALYEAGKTVIKSVWERNPEEFTFRNLSVNGKIWHGGFTKSLALDQDYTIPAVADTFNARPGHYYDSVGYTFVGWIDGLGNKYEDGATIPAATINALYEAGKTVIKSVWTPIEYTLQFNAGIKDGVVLGTFANGTRFYRVVSNIEDTTPITAEIPTRTGYELLGWKVAGIKDTTFDAGYEFTVAELLELGATVSYYDEDCKQPYFKFTAVWDASDVTVEYTFATEADRELPSEVTALVPVDENVYHAGDIVTVPTLAATTVETEEGTWTFVDWNLKEGATEFTVQPEDAENGILITGYWSFTEKVEEPETEEEPKPEKPEPKFDMPKLNLRSIVIDTTEGGKTSVASGRCYGALGSTYRLAITPDEGFEIDEVLVNGKPAEVNKNNKVSFVVKGNTYVEVSFVEIED